MSSNKELQPTLAAVDEVKQQAFTEVTFPTLKKG